jgi:hypothetical protein
MIRGMCNNVVNANGCYFVIRNVQVHVYRDKYESFEVAVSSLTFFL